MHRKFNKYVIIVQLKKLMIKTITEHLNVTVQFIYQKVFYTCRVVGNTCIVYTHNVLYVNIITA